MKQYLVVTQNPHKLEEIREKISRHPELASLGFLSLKEMDFEGEIEEPYDKLQENALAKAAFAHSTFGLDCFADDTGLEVEALNGRPGVYSARYAGPGCSYADNVRKLLKEMEGQSRRQACFRTVICLIDKGKAHFFEGKVHGHILSEAQGKGGFGYDPVFVPEGYTQSFAQMSLDEKNRISHRARALDQMIAYFRTQNTQSSR